MLDCSEILKPRTEESDWDHVIYACSTDEVSLFYLKQVQIISKQISNRFHIPIGQYWRFSLIGYDEYLPSQIIPSWVLVAGVSIMVLKLVIVSGPITNLHLKTGTWGWLGCSAVMKTSSVYHALREIIPKKKKKIFKRTSLRDQPKKSSKETIPGKRHPKKPVKHKKLL